MSYLIYFVSVVSRESDITRNKHTRIFFLSFFSLKPRYDRHLVLDSKRVRMGAKEDFQRGDVNVLKRES